MDGWWKGHFSCANPDLETLFCLNILIKSKTKTFETFLLNYGLHAKQFWYMSTETDLLFYLAPRQFRKLVYDVCRHLATRARIVVKVMCQFFCHPVPYFQVFCSVVNPDLVGAGSFPWIRNCLFRIQIQAKIKKDKSTFWKCYFFFTLIVPYIKYSGMIL